MSKLLVDEIPWRKYLETECNQLQKLLLEEVFLRCENFIDFLSPSLSLKQEKPKLFIVKEDKNKAGHKNGKIYIFEGFIKPFKSVNEDVAIHLGRNVTCAFLFWVIAHEFFHYSRQHPEIKKKFGSIYDKALEFDADKHAIEALYHFVKNRFLTEKISFDVKESILISLFYPIRNRVRPEDYRPYNDASHPFWPLRLYYLLTLLAAFDNPSVFSINSVKDKARLEEILINLESDYKNDLSYLNDMVDLNYYIINHSEDDFKKLMLEYAAVIHLFNNQF